MSDLPRLLRGFHAAAVFGAVLALGACGGSSGSSSPDGAEVPGGGPPTTVDLSSLESLLARTDTLLASSAVCLFASDGPFCGDTDSAVPDGDPAGGADDPVSRGSGDDGPWAAYERFLLRFSCSGPICELNWPGSPFGESGALTISVLAALSAQATASPAGTVGGIDLVHRVAAQPDEGLTVAVYGAWLDDSFFAVRGTEGRIGGQEGPPAHLLVQGVAGGVAATGFLTGTGTARWDGAVVARSVDPAGGPLWPEVSGIATVTVDLDVQTAGVAFSGLTGPYGDPWRTPRIDAWSDARLPVVDGAFAAPWTREHELSGQFFGAGHGEVAGVFRFDGLAGAFGGARVAP